MPPPPPPKRSPGVCVPQLSPYYINEVHSPWRVCSLFEPEPTLQQVRHKLPNETAVVQVLVPAETSHSLCIGEVAEGVDLTDEGTPPGATGERGVGEIEEIGIVKESREAL